jgi:hypothetical protein
VRGRWAAAHNAPCALLTRARAGDLEGVRELCGAGAAGSVHASGGAVLRCAAARGDAALAAFVAGLPGGAPQVGAPVGIRDGAGVAAPGAGRPPPWSMHAAAGPAERLRGWGEAHATEAAAATRPPRCPGPKPPALDPGAATPEQAVVDDAAALALEGLHKPVVAALRAAGARCDLELAGARLALAGAPLHHAVCKG